MARKAFLRFKRFSDLIGQFGLFLSGIFIVLMMLHIVADVASDFLFDRPLLGTLEVVSYYYMIGVVFLPLAFIEKIDAHISVDMLYIRFSDKIKIIVYCLSCFVGLLFYALFVYLSFSYAFDSTRNSETIMANFNFYIWPARWLLPIGFGMYCLALFSNGIGAMLGEGVPEADSADSSRETGGLN